MIITKFYQDDSGSAAAEYVILLSCIATVIIMALAIFGGSVHGMYAQGNTIFNR